MPTSAYNTLLKTVSSYVDPQTTVEVLRRQLKACNLSAETVATADLKTLASRVATACGLYISDTTKRNELKDKLMAL